MNKHIKTSGARDLVPDVLLKMCSENSVFGVIYKSARLLFGRFLFLFGAKYLVSSVMMPASLLLQLTPYTRLKFKNRLDMIFRTHR